MISHPCLISAGHAESYYEKDDYFTRSSDGGGGIWHGKLRDYFNLPERIETKEFNEIIRQNELTRHMAFRFKVFDSLYSNMSNEKSKSEILEIQKRAILETMKVIKKEYPAINFERKRNPFTSEKEFVFSSDQKCKGTYITLINSTDIRIKNCGIFNKVKSGSPKLLRIYIEKFQKYAEEKGYKINPNDLKRKNGSFIIERGRVGFDIAFNVPKSLSIVMFMNNKKYFDLIRSIQHKAVLETLDFLQKNFVYYNKYKNNKKDTFKADRGMVFAILDHYSNRNLEPHYHCHVLGFDNILDKFGRPARLENEKIYKNRYLLQGIYHSSLMRNLKENGFEFTISNDKMENFELVGFDRKIIEAFSSRRREIVQELERIGKKNSNGKDKSFACLLTRKAKENVDFDLLVQSWQNDFEFYGLKDFEPKQGLLVDHSFEKKIEFLEKVMNELTDSKTAFTRYEFMYLAIQRGMNLCISNKDVDSILSAKLQNNELLFDRVGKETYFFSKESVDMEKAIYRNIKSGIGECPGLPIGDIKKNLKESEKRLGIRLTKDQVKAVKFLSVHDRFLAIQGDAGVGKTTLLKEMNYHLAKAGYSIKSMCFMGSGAENTYLQAGIPSSTVHNFLNGLEKIAGNYNRNQDQFNKKNWNLMGLGKSTEKEIWLVDEFSMISNRLMLKLQEAAIRRDAKVIFIGDFKQIQSIGGGAICDKLINEKIIHHVKIKENVRHRNKVDKSLFDAIKLASESFEGDLFKGNLQKVYESLKSIKKKITIVPDKILPNGAPDPSDRISYITKLYTKLPTARRDNTYIMTSQNIDRENINKSIREALMEKGYLKPGKIYKVKGKDGKVRSKEFSVNDNIIFLNNSILNGHHVHNGTVGKITDLQDSVLTVNVRGQSIQVYLDNYNYFDHSYCRTVHKSLGSTIPEKAIYHVDVNQKASNFLNSFYVSLTRSNKDIEIVTNGSIEDLANLFNKKQYRFSILDTEGEMGLKKSLEIDYSEFNEPLEEPAISELDHHLYI